MFELDVTGGDGALFRIGPYTEYTEPLNGILQVAMPTESSNMKSLDSPILECRVSKAILAHEKIHLQLLTCIQHCPIAAAA